MKSVKINFNSLIRLVNTVCRFDPEVEGGESLFLDSFHVAEEFRKQFPEDFDNLVRIPGTFQKIHFERYTPKFCFSLSQNTNNSTVVSLVIQNILTQVQVLTHGTDYMLSLRLDWRAI